MVGDSEGEEVVSWSLGTAAPPTRIPSFRDPPVDAPDKDPWAVTGTDPWGGSRISESAIKASRSPFLAGASELRSAPSLQMDDGTLRAMQERIKALGGVVPELAQPCGPPSSRTSSHPLYTSTSVLPFPRTNTTGSTTAKEKQEADIIYSEA